MMDSIEVDKSLYDIGEGDLKDLWGSDSFDSNIGDIGLGSETDWTNLLDNQPIILHDRMMSDAVQSPRIQSEHSYSLTVGDEMPDSPLGLHPNIKMEDYSKDMENDCFPAIPMSSSHTPSDFSGVVIKQEPSSPPPSSSSSPHHNSEQSRTCSGGSSSISSLLQSSIGGCLSSSLTSSTSSSHPQSLLKPPTILLATRPSSNSLFTSTTNGDRRLVYPKVNIKLESLMSSSGFCLPPTPPSSTGSDSEGSLSPVHGPAHPASPPSLLLSGTGGTHSLSSGGKRGTHSSSNKLGFSSSSGNSLTRGAHSNNNNNAAGSNHNSSNSSSTLISSQPKGATGVLMLTDEEKRTLMAEGYPIPQRLPLTKAEERSLKKIRRKIKNKISAQESRRKKKEYMDALEKKVEILTNENNDYKRRMDFLEGNNKSLLSQLQKLQAICGDFPDKCLRTAATQTFKCSDELSIPDDEEDSFVQSVEMMELVESQCR